MSIHEYKDKNINYLAYSVPVPAMLFRLEGHGPGNHSLNLARNLGLPPLLKFPIAIVQIFPFRKLARHMF